MKPTSSDLSNIPNQGGLYSPLCIPHHFDAEWHRVRVSPQELAGANLAGTTM